MTYPGGKNGAGVYQALINLMPPHDVYIEPFLGGGAIMRLKRPARYNIGIDLDGTVRHLAMPAAATDSAMDTRGFHFLQGDGIELLRRYNFTGKELVYCDPPYIRSTRSCARDLYKYEMTDADHRRLLRVLLEVKAMVMVSGYPSKLYAQMLKGWNTATYTAVNRAGTAVTETVWFNYPRPVELHDWRYLGSNFRERERIKRKTARWLSQLMKMPAIERQALRAAISAIELV